MPRRRLLVALALALAGAAVVVVAALAARGGPSRGQAAGLGQRIAGRPPLVYALPARLAPSGTPAERMRALSRLGDPARDAGLALALAAASLDAGEASRASAALDQAARRLGRDDVRVAVGRAVAGYDTARPERSGRILAALAAAHPDDPLPAFERGLVLLYAGRERDAIEWLRAVRDQNPDSEYALLADNVLHAGSGMRPGYPIFVPVEVARTTTLAAARRMARARPRDRQAQLGYAVELQSAGRRGAALTAARRAAAVAPGDVEAQVAVAVLGFDKDRPAVSVGALGGLIKAHPTAPSPVFHLAQLLTWIGQDRLARKEFEKAARIDPRGRLGAVARAVLRPAGSR